MIRYVILVALFLSACSNAEPYLPLAAPEDPSIGPSRDGERSLVIGGKADGASDTRALTAAYNASGHELFKRFAAAPGNIVFSPYSIGTAMAMVLSGARGDTEKEMAAVLKHSLKRPQIGEANAGVLAILSGYDKSSEPSCPGAMRLSRSMCEGPKPASGRCSAPAWTDGDRCLAQPVPPKSARLKIANALMLTKAGGGIVAPAYASLLRDRYAAEIFHDAGVAQVNGWVSKQTEGKIAKLFDQVHPDTALVLVNAVYFKATWESRFQKTATKDEDFHLSSSAKVRVPTMHQRGDFRVLKRSGYRAIRLPYSVKPLSMVVVLPDTIDGATALARRLDAAEVASMLAGLQTTRLTDLAMPRLKAEFKTNLVGAFQQMGMKRPFEEARADLSGITGRATSAAPIAIDQIIHNAVIEVDEEGTEAAAATGVTTLLVSTFPEAEAFNIDRPFLFYIVDDATGAILFQGRIDDPRKA